MTILSQSKNNYETITHQAAETIKTGGIIVLAFDTVYGFACDPKNDQALERIFKLKSRSLEKTVGTATFSVEKIKEYANLSAEQAIYIEKRVPGPYTFILPSIPLLPEEGLGVVEASNQLSHYCYKNGTLAVRIPDNKLVLDVTKAAGIIAQTSANKAGQPNCYSLDELKNQFTEEEINSIDLIVDGGELEKSNPSTLVDLTKDTPIEIER